MGLIHPGILAGLFALALPVLIHFIRSRKYERVDIGALRFLRVAIQERRRWRRIENWPLLLARLAVVALLTLLFARPFFPDREKIAPAAARHWLAGTGQLTPERKAELLKDE